MRRRELKLYFNPKYLKGEMDWQAVKHQDGVIGLNGLKLSEEKY
jgi:hypothetical protein